MNTDSFLTIPAEEYHAASRCGRYMSSHNLAAFRESSELYRRKTNGEIAESESPALALGRAAHCLILEGRAAFDEQYLVADGPVNPKTGEPYGKATKAYAEWIAAQTREIVSPKDFGFIVKLQKSVWLHDAASALLNDGVSEATVRAEYCGVPCQIRMDWFSREYGIVDLKTCDSLKWFEGDCKRFGYVFQMAFYRAVLREATGETVAVHLIAVEKNEPFSTGVWELPGDVLDRAPEFIYKDLSANLPEVWKVGSGCGVFKLCGSGASRLPGCAKEINGIAVTLGTTGGIDTQENGNYYASFKSTDYSEWRNYAAVQLAISSQSNGTHEPVIARNITVTHPRGIALYASNCYVKTCTLQGMLRAYSVTCDIASLTSWCPGNAVGAAYGSTIRIGTLTLGRGNISGTDSDPAVLGSPMESQSFVYVGSSNAQLMGDTRSTSTSYDNCYAVACGSEIDEGHYTMRTLNAMCNTWGVARSGSAVPASLKLSNNTAEGTGFLSLGRQPFGGFKVAVASAGVRKLKVYVAAKGLSEIAELARRVVVQAAVPGADGSERTAFSSASGRWSEDASAWIGESGLTAFALEMPLEIPAACTVDVKIHFRWYSASGYLYIDPGIAIE